MPVETAATLPDRLLRHCRVVPDRHAILPHIPKGGTFVEVGVALGDFSQAVLDGCAPARFVAIDLFTLHRSPQMWGGEIGRRLEGMEHEAWFRRRFAADPRVAVLRGDSRAALATLPDAGADVIYLDADHAHASVAAEIAVARRKLRPDGWLWFNDYTFHDPYAGEAYGVPRAVHDFMLESGWEAIFLALHPSGFYDIVTRHAA